MQTVFQFLRPLRYGWRLQILLWVTAAAFSTDAADSQSGIPGRSDWWVSLALTQEIEPVQKSELKEFWDAGAVYLEQLDRVRQTLERLEADWVAERYSQTGPFESLDLFGSAKQETSFFPVPDSVRHVRTRQKLPVDPEIRRFNPPVLRLANLLGLAGHQWYWSGEYIDPILRYNHYRRSMDVVSRVRYEVWCVFVPEWSSAAPPLSVTGFRRYYDSRARSESAHLKIDSDVKPKSRGIFETKLEDQDHKRNRPWDRESMQSQFVARSKALGFESLEVSEEQLASFEEAIQQELGRLRTAFVVELGLEGDDASHNPMREALRELDDAVLAVIGAARDMMGELGAGLFQSEMVLSQSILKSYQVKEPKPDSIRWRWDGYRALLTGLVWETIAHSPALQNHATLKLQAVLNARACTQSLAAPKLGATHP
jgi:hypothetical protein